jgi:plasmid maintenance system antidote protein VapI
LKENNVAKRKIDPVHPGAALAEDLLKEMELSQYRLAKGIAMPAQRINEIAQGKRGSESFSAWRRSSG